MKKKEKTWISIQKYIKSNFNVKPNIHNIIFLIGVQELGYGFMQLDQDTKTKVINFASMYIMKYLSEEEKNMIEKKDSCEDYIGDEVYKTAIINYFKFNKII